MNKGLLFVGAISHQHIQGFSASIRRYSDYKLYGIDFSDFKDEPEQFEKVLFIKSTKIYLCNQIKRIFLSAWYIFKLRNKISVVQFHSASIYAFISAPIARALGLSVSYFIWGSDLMRANKLQRFLASIVYRNSHSVVCDSNSVADIFKIRYPKMQQKLEVLYFGSPIIDRLLEKSTLSQVPDIENCNNKLVVMCGYNGSTEQNHFKILASLEKYKERIYVIIPMTYRTTNDYIDKIRQYLDSNQFSYLILDSFLTDEEWSKYEMDTNIFIHMQDTDAFSSSVAEHLLLGNILINADWIDYPDLTSNGIYYETANFDNLSNVFGRVLADYNSYHKKYSDNCDKIYKLKSQYYCVHNYWLPYYGRMIQRTRTKNGTIH